VTLIVDAVTFLYSALVIGRLDLPDRPVEAKTDEALRRRVLMGARFVLSDRYLRAGLGCSTTINFFTFMMFALLVLFASRDLGLSAGVIGLALGIGSLGGLLGATIAPALSRRFGVGPMVVVGAVLFPLPFGLLVVAGGDTWLGATFLVAFEFVAAIGVMIFDINLNSIQASVVPDGMRSRVSGAYSTVNYGCRPLGALLGGFLGETIGVRETFLVATIGGVASVLFLVWSPIPAVRDVDELEPATVG
jgi:predicted MFS family arabinose efflux permease